MQESKLQKLISEAYDNAVKKGFQPTYTDTVIMDLISEVCEARNAWNEGRTCDEKWLRTYLSSIEKKRKSDSVLKSMYEKKIHHTAEDELSDIYIVLFAFCGDRRISAETITGRYIEEQKIFQRVNKWVKITSLVDSYFCSMICEIHDLNMSDIKSREVAQVFVMLNEFCNHHGIDIDSHIRAKMHYNISRPYRNGKKQRGDV